MAQHKGTELLAGAVVLAVAIGFLGYALANTGRSIGGGYALHARFDRIDGLNIGSDVRIAGVKVGSVTNATLDPQSFRAIVSFTVADDVKLPKDSDAVISSDGLLGGKYLALEPGADNATLGPGGEITLTQSSISIEQLLGKFIYGGVGNGGAAAAPAPGQKPTK